ncbi:MAG: hypothetical protein JWO54_872 [Candidatus Saccharibacteria bacterium]|nr:hypothetical protein [Candidatus Saccharibacteria bacterium]
MKGDLVSLKFKHPIAKVTVALAGFSLVLGGSAAAAIAAETPTEDVVSTGTIESSSKQETLPGSSDATTEQPVAQESAPIATKPPVVVADPEPAAAAAPAPSATVTTEVTQSTPSEEAAVVTEEAKVITVDELTTQTYPQKCVRDFNYSYGFDDSSLLTTITFSAVNTKVGDKVCDGLAVRAAMRPMTGVGTVFPQGKAVYNDLLVDSIGTFTVSVPNWNNKCAQADIHAQWVSKGGFKELVMSDVLIEAQNPKEPPFLHDILKGKGPYPTWKVTSATGCNVPVPETVTGTISFETLTCTLGSKNGVVASAAPGGIWSISDNKGHSKDLAVIGAGYTGGLPSGFPYGTGYTFTLRDGDSKDLYTVTPSVSGVWTPVEKPANCDVIDAAATVTTSAPSCTEISKPSFEIYYAKWDEEADLTVGDHARSATALPGHRFHSQSSPEGSTTTTVFYTIEAALGNQSTDVNAPCYVAPQETTTPPKAETVSNVKHPQPSNLASTGADIAATLWGMFALFFAAAVAFIIDRLRRRKVVADQ